MTKLSKAKRHLLIDFILIVFSVLIAGWLVKSGLIVSWFVKTESMRVLGSLIAGFFFSSIFTAAPATVVLGQIAQANSILLVAFLGAVGAMMADFILFYFVRDRVAQDFLYLIQVVKPKRLISIFHLRLFRFIMPFIGALIIASPLPDELGLMMLGLSKVKTKFFLLLVFSMNFLGIVIIGLVARSI